MSARGKLEAVASAPPIDYKRLFNALSAEVWESLDGLRFLRESVATVADHHDGVEDEGGNRLRGIAAVLDGIERKLRAGSEVVLSENRGAT